VTALHNHFFSDEPRAYFMHVHGMGKVDDLVHRVMPGLDLIGKVTPARFSPLAASGTPLNVEKLARIVGRSGEQTAPVYKITVGRDDLPGSAH